MNTDMKEEKLGRAPLPPEWERVTGAVIQAAIEVHKQLGPGLLEKLYEAALVCQLGRQGVQFRAQSPQTVHFHGQVIGHQVLDLVVEELVVVELKAVEQVLDVHKAQLLSYLRIADLPLGLLINFNVDRLMSGLTRRINQHSSLFKTLALP